MVKGGGGGVGDVCVILRLWVVTTHAYAELQVRFVRLKEIETFTI